MIWRYLFYGIFVYVSVSSLSFNSWESVDLHRYHVNEDKPIGDVTVSNIKKVCLSDCLFSPC